MGATVVTRRTRMRKGCHVGKSWVVGAAAAILVWTLVAQTTWPCYPAYDYGVPMVAGPPAFNQCQGPNMPLNVLPFPPPRPPANPDPWGDFWYRDCGRPSDPTQIGPIIVADGTVTESATDAVLPGVEGVWAHRRMYSSTLNPGMNVQGAGWKVDGLTSFLSPEGGTYQQFGDWETYVSPFRQLLVQYIQDTQSYACPDQLRATFEDYLAPWDNKHYSKLEFPLTGRKYFFADGSTDWGGYERGALKVEADAYGNKTTYNYSSTARRVESVVTEQGWYVVYTYLLGYQSNAGKISQVDVHEGGPGGPILQQVKYTYYSIYGGDPTYSMDLGSGGDLIMVEVKTRTTAGVLASARTTMYRYYNGLSNSVLTHKLKMVLSPASVAQAMAESGKSATDLLAMDDDEVVAAGKPTLESYADVSYDYYTSNFNTANVIGEDLQTKYGCSGWYESGRVKTQAIHKGSAGAIGTHTFYYMSNMPATTLNHAQWVTVEDFNGTRRIYGTNRERLLVREVFVDDPDGQDRKYWCQSLLRGDPREDTSAPNVENRILKERGPAAHRDIDTDPEVEDFLDATDDDGLNSFTVSGALIHVYTYDARGCVTANRIEKKGDGEATSYVRCTEYGNGVAAPQSLPVKTYDYHTASDTEKDDSASVTTEISYEFWEDDENPPPDMNARHQIKLKTITQEAIDDEENGSEVKVATKEYYDSHGRLRWVRDGEGHVHYRSYHPDTGGLALEVKDVNTAALNALITGTGGGRWECWSGDPPFARTATATPLELATQTDYDGLGRQTRTEDAEGMITCTVYLDNETRVYPGWNTTSHTATLPIQVAKANAGGLKTEEYAINPGGVVEDFDENTGLPTGGEAGEEGQDDYVSWTRYAYYDDAATGGSKNTGLLKWLDRYHKIPEAGSGTLSTDFHRTVNRYDAIGLQTHVIEVVSGTDPDSDQEGVGCTEQVTVTTYDARARTVALERGVSAYNHKMGPDYGTDPTLKKTSETFCDESTPGSGAPGVGEGLATSTLSYYDAGTVDENHAVKTIYHHDWRGRLRGTEPEVAPFTVQDVDFRGKVVATAQFISEPNWEAVLAADTYAGNTDGAVAGRRTLTKTCYDQAGRAYRTETYAVDSNGAAGDKVVADTFYDRNSRVVAAYSPGKGGTEEAFDGAGRKIETRTVTELETTKYDAQSGAFNYRDPKPGAEGGDESVIELHRTVYDKVGNVLEAIAMEANHDDTTNVGIDLTANDDFVQTAVYSWYDSVHRLTTTAAFGTGKTAAPYWTYNTLTRPANEPASSGDASGLVTKQEYNGATGLLDTVTDPRGIETRYFYDALGRKTFVVGNYKEGGAYWTSEPDAPESRASDECRITRFTYDGLGNILTQTALDPDADGNTADNQTTTYTFADAYNARLATKVAYPDSTGVNDTISTTYALDGQAIEQTDQRGTVLAFEYDVTFRRLVKQTVTTLGNDVYDGADAVRRIQTDYDDLGRRSTITSYTLNGETYTALNQVRYAYNDLGALEKEYQEHEGAVGDNTLYVRYNYDTSSAGNVYTKAMRLASVRYPGVFDAQAQEEHLRPASAVASRLVHRLYVDAGGGSGIGDAISRITAISAASTRPDETNVLASYAYNGVGRLVVEDRPQPQVRLDYYNDYDGNPVPGTYEGLDRYGRVINHLWRDYGAGAYLDRCAYAYDYNSNRTWRENNGPAASGKDEKYAYDDLNRLTEMQRGNRSGDAIQDTNRQEDFTLDQVGNWKTYQVDADGDGNFTDATDLNQNRAVNNANEVTGITEQADPQQPHWPVPAYDARGNMKTVPRPGDLANAFACRYDAWNRLVEVKDGDRVHAMYEYDGLNRRIKTSVDSDATGGPDAWRHFYYTNDWQALETRETSVAGSGAENDPPETLQPEYHFVWSGRYIDALVRRDANTDTDDLCDDGTLYALSDANQNVTALVEPDGDVAERYEYDPYGNVTIYDDDWSETRSESAYANTILFAGYWRDSETGLYHVRNRMYHVRLGLWLQRDPQGYVDGMSLYEYVGGRPITALDSYGLMMGHGWGEMQKSYLRAEAKYNLLTRGAGVLGAAGGLAEGVMGCGVTFGSVGLLGALGGFQMWVHGADVMEAGLTQAWTGKEANTRTHAAINDVAQKAGASPATAEQIAKYGDAALSAVNMAAAAPQLTSGTLSRANQTLNLSGTPQATEAVRGAAGAVKGNAVSDSLREVNAPKTGEPPQLVRGKRAHAEEPVLPGETPEVRTPSGKRMDRYDADKAHIREIKPDTPRAIRQGEKQVQGYKDEMEGATGRAHTTEVSPYDPDKY